MPTSIYWYVMMHTTVPSRHCSTIFNAFWQQLCRMVHHGRRHQLYETTLVTRCCHTGIKVNTPYIEGLEAYARHKCRSAVIVASRQLGLQLGALCSRSNRPGSGLVLWSSPAKLSAPMSCSAELQSS